MSPAAAFPTTATSSAFLSTPPDSRAAETASFVRSFIPRSAYLPNRVIPAPTMATFLMALPPRTRYPHCTLGSTPSPVPVPNRLFGAGRTARSLAGTGPSTGDLRLAIHSAWDRGTFGPVTLNLASARLTASGGFLMADATYDAVI